MKKRSTLALTKFELSLWILSCSVMIAGYVVAPENGSLNFIASLIGVTALIFVAKGHAVGQLLTIVFAVLYGIISLELKYYGEMITYVCMSAPMALCALIAWIKHPYKDSSEVEISTLSKKKGLLLLLSSSVVTFVFYFILKWLGTASLLVSTISVTTSYIASALTFLRSPYYALAYSANDIALIILWIIASVGDPSYIVMAACFVMFLFNDLYGFFNWQRMKRNQTHAK